ncbi:MAG: MmgE/PrpD family protein, partial [Chloroflexi bacterium]|nr:MmgE/PrpD family protein [Chloroflexota bacterium]
MNGQTRQLAQYAAGLGFTDIPSHVIDRLKLHLLDAAGAAIYGGQLPWTVIVKSVVSAWRGNPEATVWNTDIRVPASQAAFINSVATHAFELDDRRVASYMHPASATFPAGLAVSESLSRKVNGRELLTAIVAGYEVGLRVGKAIGRGSAERGFYPPGIGGAFAAVVTAGRLWGLKEGDFPHAFNVTATQVSGLYSPTMIKRLNIGAGTHS